VQAVDGFRLAMTAGRRCAMPALLVAAAGVLAAQTPQRPTFTARTDVALVDVQVVTNHGEPIVDLGLEDFTVELDGNRRRIASVELVRYDQPVAAAPGTSPPAGLDGPASAAPPRRQYILAVDESSFSTMAALAWKAAIQRFVERLQPGDLAGLYAYPVGGSLVPLTDDRSAVLDGVDGVVGRLELPVLNHQMSLSEVADITAGDREVAERVAERECPRAEFRYCRDFEIPREAAAFAREMEVNVAQSIGGLRTLMRSPALRDLPGRKTVVVVSGGLLQSDRIGGRMDMNHEITVVAEDAASANINLYVLHLDSSFIEMFSPRNRIGLAVLRDGTLQNLGLDRFAGMAGGELIRVQAGTGDYAFDRVLRETSAYYLLAVEPDERDRDGRPHKVRVQVNRRGAVVRSRAYVVVPAAGGW
jgi:VWFA-related protein